MGRRRKLANAVVWALVALVVAAYPASYLALRAVHVLLRGENGEIGCNRDLFAAFFSRHRPPSACTLSKAYAPLIFAERSAHEL